MIDDTNPEMQAVIDEMENDKSTHDGDMALLEMLFRKVQSNHGIEKTALLKRLASQQNLNGPILNKGLDSHNGSSAVQDSSQQEVPSGQPGNDFLMDENILPTSPVRTTTMTTTRAP
jgi:hypothetical protein